jgi:hypothetical protein
MSIAIGFGAADVDPIATQRAGRASLVAVDGGPRGTFPRARSKTKHLRTQQLRAYYID